jgi:ADP-ribose pyrophosphatase YjhB (NUDIX family)
MISEKSVMAVVVCNNKILTTHEIIYGELKIALPKGHLEIGESLNDCAIRETFEEVNIVINYNQFYKQLNNFEIKYINHHDQEVSKTIVPLLFFIDEEGNPQPKEERMIKVEYLGIEEFLIYCSYDNVRAVIEEARKYIK